MLSGVSAGKTIFYFYSYGQQGNMDKLFEIECACASCHRHIRIRVFDIQVREVFLLLEEVRVKKS